jgi:hypothetical protein
MNVEEAFITALFTTENRIRRVVVNEDATFPNIPSTHTSHKITDEMVNEGIEQ